MQGFWKLKMVKEIIYTIVFIVFSFGSDTQLSGLNPFARRFKYSKFRQIVKGRKYNLQLTNNCWENISDSSKRKLTINQ